MHVIHLAPEFPAAQRNFVRGLKNVGARVTGIGDGRHPDPEVMGLLDAYVRVSNVTDERAVAEAVRRIQAHGPPVHALEATIEAHMYTAASVREATGIPGLSYETVDLCRDKFTMKRFLQERGVPSARNAAVSTAEEAWAFTAQVGYPCILKPRDGAGASHTYRLNGPGDLERALVETGLNRQPRHFTMEEFNLGHEGFWDTLTVNGKVEMEFVSHYYPNVLYAMRNAKIPAMILTTNRIDASGYDEVRKMGRKVLTSMGIGTAPTHMEWFFGPKGLRFSEIGARPPGVSMWDVYCAANDIDLYTEWARAVCWGDVHAKPSRQYSGALMSIRPTAQGTVRGYTGVQRMQDKYGHHIVKAYLPPVGSRTQAIEAGYMANAWVMARHPDYDTLKAMMDDIGANLIMHAG